jgi:hypothetical protein
MLDHPIFARWPAQNPVGCGRQERRNGLRSVVLTVDQQQ